MKNRLPLTVTAALVTLASPAAAQETTPHLTDVTTPRAYLGFDIGADYQLATWEQLAGYWRRLAAESDRMVLDTIGFTSEGRPQLMGILTSPANHQDLDRYREISRTLADARVGPEEAAALASEGKAVVWIDGGLHATEVLGAQQLMQLVYDMVSLTDEETLRFLDDVILLTPHANPDGHALVADWYLREDDPLERSTDGIPVLYQKYAGHDNNRDFYMANLVETQNMNRVAYREWFPQIMYNHHQTGPDGTVMFAPPFRDPPNHNLHPLVLPSLLQVGSHMHARFVREGKGGTTMRSGASYSTWWNGGLRTTPYYHNMIGLLTETIGHPTPIEIPFIADRQLTTSDLPLPVEPGPWRFEQSVDYSQTANRAVLDFASRNRRLLLEGIWRMGRDAIERGRRDSWDNIPAEIDAAQDAILEGGVLGGRRGDTPVGSLEDHARLLRAPEDREPRGYVLPADQPDFNTALDFINALLMNGVEVHRATAAFDVDGTSYPEGSIVVKTDQAFAPHVFDMFEPQNHPNDFAYPGGPPIPPYDLTGWTLALQMGVEFDRVLDGFDGPFEVVDEWNLDPEPGAVTGVAAADAYLLDGRVNDAVAVVNEVLRAGGRVLRMEGDVRAGGMRYPSGAYALKDVARDQVARLARESGVDALAVDVEPAGRATELRPVRVALWDRYGGSMPSGWIRFILEDFGFSFDVLYPPDIDAGHLADYDVLVLPDGALDERRTSVEPEDVPEAYRGRMGSVTRERTLPMLEAFVRGGGTLVAIGDDVEVARWLGLEVTDHLVDDAGEPLARERFFVPGSLLAVDVDRDHPLAFGLGDRVDVLFARNPVLRVADGADGLRVFGTYASPRPLVSGWAWGQEHLEGGAAFVEGRLGGGRVVLFGPEITFRAQSHGTYPLLFNALLRGG